VPADRPLPARWAAWTIARAMGVQGRLRPGPAGSPGHPEVVAQEVSDKAPYRQPQHPVIANLNPTLTRAAAERGHPNTSRVGAERSVRARGPP
jgi:hypothetical protein